MKHLIKCLKATIAISLVLCGTVSSTAIADDSKTVSGNNGDACVKVTLSLYSGRPDPVFMICDEATLESIRSEIAFSKVDNVNRTEPVIPAYLGYRGIIVENVDNVVDMPKRMAMNKGDIEVADTSQKNYLLDDGVLEDVLLNEALLRGVIDQRTFQYIQDQR